MVQTLSHLPEEGTLTEAADTQQQGKHTSCPTFSLQVLHHKGFLEGEVIQRAGQAAGEEEFRGGERRQAQQISRAPRAQAAISWIRGCAGSFLESRRG